MTQRKSRKNSENQEKYRDTNLDAESKHRCSQCNVDTEWSTHRKIGNEGKKFK
jgi:hypothetical protein